MPPPMSDMELLLRMVQTFGTPVAMLGFFVLWFKKFMEGVNAAAEARETRLTTQLEHSEDYIRGALSTALASMTATVAKNTSVCDQVLNALEKRAHDKLPLHHEDPH